MKNKLSLVSVVAVAATFLTTPSAQAAVAVEDLGTLPGHQLSIATDINEFGTVTGVSMSSDGRSANAVRWDRYSPISKLDDLGFGSWATAVNGASNVVGYVADSTNRARAARWDDRGRLTVLTVPGADSSVAWDINDNRTVVGDATINGVSHAVVWDRDGVAFVVGEGRASHVTSDDTVIGYSGTAPARWTNAGQGSLYVYDNAGAQLHGHNQAADAVGRVGDEGVLWPGRRRVSLGVGAFPRDISDNGFAVGTSGTRAVRWTVTEPPTAVPLAPSPSVAAAINNAGVVAGTAGSWAVTWDAAGVQTALPVLAGSTSSVVTGLAENGQIIGRAGFAGGVYRAVVWR
ncbi:hypothetical protein GCM10022267_33610 [Lentzea roselyniae]|uniref:Extracellular repeat, HAF family n=1 Tax=Lentzea roselyniae TaxID=531940 RepID=A0ABP7B0S2_9PSEU